MLSVNMIDKGQGKAQTAHDVSRGQENKTMEFLTSDKGIVSHEDTENEQNKIIIKDQVQGNEGETNVKYDPYVDKKVESMPDLENGVKDEKDEKEIIREQDDIKLEEAATEDSIIADIIPKKKRARLSRLGQRPSGQLTEVGSPSKAPTKLIYALPPGLADEPLKDRLEEFREWIKIGVLKKTPLGYNLFVFNKRPPRYTAKLDDLANPHDLGFMVVDKKNWYYELATSPVWLWDKHIDVTFYYLRKKIMQFPELEQRKVTTVDTFFSSKVRSLWRVYQSSPEKFDWSSYESILTNMLGVCVQSGSSWFDMKTLLIPIHLADLKHWALVKADLTSWTIEVLNLFDFKPREPPGIYPIPITIMKDIPQQANGMFTIKFAECLIEGRDVRDWVIHERMQLFWEWLTCYFWIHAKRKIEQNYKSDDDVDVDFA
ncbi:hypothetical protein TIFTF001_045633 [Ficus carica]|uniref:Ubiquitin-like protease family profile domain-containing protein n=1 Tax=Ficus carica TaxID=3494 RepID=A0AA87ZA51_FICCA|nr:hypothetical protein TIFTF001_045633 [Ficus carica]